MLARSGTVISPAALAMLGPERVRRAHRFLINAASKSVDRAGYRDQAMRIGVTANVGGELRRSTVFRRSTRGPLFAEINHLGLCGMPCAPKGYSRQYVTVTKTARLPYRRSLGHVGQSVVKDVTRRSMCFILSASTRRSCASGPESSQCRMTGRIATLTTSWNLAPTGQLSCIPGLVSTFRGSDSNGCEHFHLMQLVSVRVREMRVTTVCGGFADQDRCSKRAVVRSRLKQSTFVVGSGDRQQQRGADDEDSTSNATLISWIIANIHRYCGTPFSGT
jgi:uncharacterized membrane protein